MLLAALAVAGPAAAQSGNRYATEINFHWDSPPPERLLEDDPVTGQQVQTPVSNPQSWRGSQAASTALSEIQVRFHGRDFVFPYRSFRGAPPLDLHLEMPAFTCAPSDIDAIERALGQPRQPQLVAMLAAGTLLQSPQTVCPDSSKRRLADYYYRLNCQLSSSTSYVGYYVPAEKAYARRWDGNANQLRLVPLCRQNAQKMYRDVLAEWRGRLVTGERYQEAIALADDIDRLAAAPEWAETMGSLKVAAVDRQAWHLRAILANQLAAQGRGQWREALSQNAVLRRVAGSSEADAALARAQLDRTRISADAELLGRSVSLLGPAEAVGTGGTTAVADQSAPPAERHNPLPAPAATPAMPAQAASAPSSGPKSP
jgi:hypothetical protein